MYEESKQSQFGVSYEAKSIGIGKVHDISWKCRYCGVSMSEGKLFSHEATCSSKPKVPMKMPIVGFRAPKPQVGKKGRKGMMISPAKAKVVQPENNWRVKH